jgi:hypothetical protein
MYQESSCLATQAQQQCLNCCTSQNKMPFVGTLKTIPYIRKSNYLVPICKKYPAGTSDVISGKKLEKCSNFCCKKLKFLV